MKIAVYYASNQFTIHSGSMQWYHSFRAQHLSLLRLRLNVLIR